MQANAIVDLVQQRIGQDSPETAERLIQAVLETLAERDLGAHRLEALVGLDRCVAEHV